MINAGKLDKRITFCRIVQQSDEIGEHPIVEELKTVWANVKAVRGGEYYEAQKLRGELTFKITCRYFLIPTKMSDLDGNETMRYEEVSPEMIIRYKGRKFAITDAINIDEADTQYEIRATEIKRKKVTEHGYKPTV